MPLSMAQILSLSKKHCRVIQLMIAFVEGAVNVILYVYGTITRDSPVMPCDRLNNLGWYFL